MKRNSFNMSGDYYVDIDIDLRAAGYRVEPA